MSKGWWLPVLALLSRCACAQGAAGVLQEMATHAGAIFSGEVVAVARHDDAGFVEVRFHVTTAVRGCADGDTFTLREWSGRWAGHEDRYQAGQRRLMLITPPGPAGLAAPVYGADGAIPIAAGAAAAAGTASEPVVDLRLLAARAQPVAASSASGTHNDLFTVGLVALDGSSANWPVLSNVLQLLRGGSFAGL